MIYYNENDPKAAAWLRELMRVGVIPMGFVDERDIRDVKPSDLDGYTQCHFFAGIGVWSYALRLAGVDPDVPLWTGSCPCQPFSAAGKRAGTSDERHLWPHWFWLISQCRPPIVFGEQVASKDGRVWLDTVSADMEALGFTIGSADLCAAGWGAPHIRQRIFFGAHDPRLAAGGMEHADDTGSQGRGERRDGAGERVARATGVADHPSPTNGFWRDADWLGCRDGKWRPVEPGTSPLARWSPVRVGRLRGYGNAIVAPLAAEFIKAWKDVTYD